MANWWEKDPIVEDNWWEEDPVAAEGLPTGGGFQEFGKGIVRGSLNVGAGITGTLETFAKAKVTPFRGFAPPEEWLPPKEKRAEPFKRARENIQEAAKRLPVTHRGAAAWTGRVVGEAIPYMGAALAAGYAVGPIGAAAIGFSVEGQGAYDEAIAAGASEDDAQTDRIIVGSINAAIEAVQIGKLMKFHKTGKHSAKSFIQLVRNKAWKKAGKQGLKFGGEILKLSVEEGLEEFSQEGVSLTVPAILRDQYPRKADKTPDWWAIGERLGEAALGGAVAGGILGGAGAVRGLVAPAEVAPVAEEVAPEAEVWDKKQANDYLISINDTLKKAGYVGEIIGSVKEKGISTHDLDIKLTTTRKDFNAEILIEELGGDFTMDMKTLEIKLPDGKVIDFHFEEEVAPVTEAEEKIYKGKAFRTLTGTIVEGTAADVVRFEQEELGNDLGVTKKQLKELEKQPASDIVWVTREKVEAARYAQEDIDVELTTEDLAAVEEIDVTGGKIIADIGPDGILVLKKPVPEVEKPVTPEQVIAEKYGISAEETEQRLAEAETRYRELKQKPTEERSKAEREELAFLRRNRKDIEAILGRETAPPIPEKKRRSRQDLLALGHVIPRELGMTEEERRDWIEVVVPGKRSLGKLTKTELLTVVEELESLTGKRVELTEEDYDKPIQVSDRTTSMRNVLKESAVTVEELPERVKIPERVRKRFIRKQRGGIGRATQQFLWGIDNSPIFHLASILSGGKKSTITDVLDTNIQQGRKGEVGHKRAVYDTIKQLNEDSGITDKDLAKMSKGLNPRFQIVQALQEQLDVGTEIMTEKINDREFDLTYANLIDIFLIAQQEDGLRHIHGGGLVINGVETGAISEDTLERLMLTLETNPKARRIADIFVKEIGEKVWKPSINKTSMEMDSKEIATVENWWGLEVAYPKKVPGKAEAYRKFNVNLIEDRRIFKDRTKSIRPLIVRDAFDRFAMFENAIAEYTSMAQPARYARTLMNQPDIAAALERKGYGNVRDNIVALLEQAQSVPAQQGAFGKFLSKLKIIPGVYRAVLFFNPRVWLSQYTSTANYAAFVSPKYMSLFTKGVTPDAIERVLEMSPIAWDRFYMGHSSLELGELGASDATLRAFTKTSSDKNKLGITLRMSDIAAIATGNEIAIAEYDDAKAGKIMGDSADWWAGKDTSFEKESEDWRRIVTERAEWLWQRSQPSWDKWNRSMITGDPSAIKRIFFLFRSFHEKSLTILQQANLEYANSAHTATDRMKQAKKYGAVLSGYTINTVLRAAVAAGLYRKIKEPFEYLSDIITAPFSMLPILGKILQTSIRNFVNVLARHRTEYRGEAIESLPVKVMNTIASAPDNFSQAAAYYLMGENEKGRKSLKRAIGKVYEGVGTAEGVPVYEIEKFYKGWIEEEKPSGAPKRRPPRR